MSIVPRFYAFSFLQPIGLNVNFVHWCCTSFRFLRSADGMEAFLS